MELLSHEIYKLTKLKKQIKKTNEEATMTAIKVVNK